MTEKSTVNDLSTWFSTYGLLTAERILERLNIHLKHDELLTAIQESTNVYYQLLRVPFKQVFNGIILGQAQDYQTYAQKLYVDYLLSDSSTKDAASPGTMAREDLEMNRLNLLRLAEDLNTIVFEHRKLIAESQAVLRELANNQRYVAPSNTSEQQRVEKTIIPYLEMAEAMGYRLHHYRNQFYAIILTTTELLKLLPDYHFDIEKQTENLALLSFDTKIGSIDNV